MKKRLLALSMAMIMVAGTLSACGSQAPAAEPASTPEQTETDVEEPTETEEETPVEETDTTETDTPAAETTGIAAPSTDGWDDSKKIMVYEWDDDFQKKLSVVLDKYPEYKDYVEFNVLGVSGTGDEYKTAVDTALAAGDAAKYPSIIPADNDVAKYWSEDDEKTLDLKSIGFTDDMLANSYDFAVQYGTFNGELKAVTWQGCPGMVFYRKDIAKEVLGADDPDTVQAAMSDWNAFFETADKLKAAGYYITAGSDEVKYAMWDQQTKPLVTVADDGSETLTLDDTLKDYFETNKKLADGGYTLGASMWDETWAANMKDDGKVFCYFACPWMVGVCTGNGATNGNWGGIVGPCSYHWGGTYAMVGKDTPNPELCAFLLYELTCDPDIAVAIANQYGDGLNNKAANDRLNNGELASDNAAMAFLGGQNPYGTWADASEKINQSFRTYQDSTIRAYIDEAAKGYTAGTYSTVDDAVAYVQDQANTQLGIPAAE